MDGSITRRGQPCWYKLVRKGARLKLIFFFLLCDSPLFALFIRVQPEVGLVAINDSFLIQSTVYKLLKHYFREKPYYVDLLELMQEVYI